MLLCRLVAKLEDPAEVETFKTNMSKVMKDLLARFKDLQFFTGNFSYKFIHKKKFLTIFSLNLSTGENMDIDGMVALMEYRDIAGESKPVMMFFKHGLLAEKF